MRSQSMNGYIRGKNRWSGRYGLNTRNMEQEYDRMIWVHWDEYDDLECWGETQCCENWEEAVEYMKKQGKKKYEIEVEE